MCNFICLPFDSFTDEHCIKLVQLGIVGPLLKLLRKEDNTEDDFVDMRLMLYLVLSEI